MSANGKFWANVEMLKSPQLRIYLDMNEMKILERCIESASVNNVLTGIDWRAAANVQKLVELVIQRQKDSQKSYHSSYGAFRRAN